MNKKSIHFSTDGLPWPSPETDAIKQKAIDKYNEIRGLYPFNEVYLVMSSHWASEGYWIEFTEPKLIPGQETLMLSHKAQP